MIPNENISEGFPNSPLSISGAANFGVPPIFNNIIYYQKDK
jgi:hypothetical protein